ASSGGIAFSTYMVISSYALWDGGVGHRAERIDCQDQTVAAYQIASVYAFRGETDTSRPFVLLTRCDSVSDSPAIESSADNKESGSCYWDRLRSIREEKRLSSRG